MQTNPEDSTVAISICARTVELSNMVSETGDERLGVLCNQSWRKVMRRGFVVLVRLSEAGTTYAQIARTPSAQAKW
jgi:hypothetical protein